MVRVLLYCIVMLLAAIAAGGEEAATPAGEQPPAKVDEQPVAKVEEQPVAKIDEELAAKVTTQTPQGDKKMSGMSILGNDDAPKALVIVPWKSSEMGDPLSVSRALDDGRQPVDKDVFMRELDYYQIRAASSATGSSGTQ